MRRAIFATILCVGSSAHVWADLEAGHDAYGRGDTAAAVQEWKPLAESGDADAQFKFGWRHEISRGVPKDDAERAKWYRKAAEKGNKFAKKRLAKIESNPEFMRQVREAAERVTPEHQKPGKERYINYLAKGDKALAFREYREAEAFYKRALALAEKLGGAEHSEVAISLIRLATVYNVQGRKAEAHKLRTRAIAIQTAKVDAGYAAYDRGDYATALREFRPLAEQGVTPAQVLMGIMYAYGKGVRQDETEAVKWLRQAAEQGSAFAHKILQELTQERKPIKK